MSAPNQPFEFAATKRGTGCRILPVSADDEDKTYFLIRHGMPFKREGKMESGESKTIFYRPEFHDVIVYDRANNELAVFNKSEELVPKSHQYRKFIEVFDFAKIKHHLKSVEKDANYKGYGVDRLFRCLLLQFSPFGYKWKTLVTASLSA